MSAVAATKKLMTADEFWHFANSPENEHRNLDLIRGEVVEMSRPTRIHGLVCSNVVLALAGWAKTVRVGYVASNDSGVVLEQAPDTVVGPDVAYYTDANTFEEVHPKWGEVPPVVAVEVLSPNDKRKQVSNKIATYLRGGVQLVWLVDYEERTVTAHRPRDPLEVFDDTRTLEFPDVLPGFTCPVCDLFLMPGQPPATFP